MITQCSCSEPEANGSFHEVMAKYVKIKWGISIACNGVFIDDMIKLLNIVLNVMERGRLRNGGAQLAIKMQLTSM